MNDILGELLNSELQSQQSTLVDVSWISFFKVRFKHFFVSFSKRQSLDKFELEIRIRSSISAVLGEIRKKASKKRAKKRKIQK